jgi:hypothetical protein
MSSFKTSSTVVAGRSALAGLRRKPTLCRPFAFSAMNSKASRAVRASRAGVRCARLVLSVRAYSRAAKLAAGVAAPKIC